MKKLFVVFILAFFSWGCGNAPPVKSIAKETEVLEEGPFRFLYPKNWKINGEVNKFGEDLEFTKYNFRHPKQRECFVAIEVIAAKGNKTSTAYFDDIITYEVKVAKKRITQGGFRNFTFQTKSANFAGQKGKQLSTSADQGSSSREMIFYLVPYKNDFYVVSYQKFSGWKEEIQKRLEETAWSFSFVR